MFKIFSIIAAILSCVEAESSSRCQSLVTGNFITNGCDIPGRLPWSVQASEMIPCEISNTTGTESDCLSQECCWFNNGCFKKPKKCYADFREEECPPRVGWRPNTIYTGWTLNGTYCFIESIVAYTSRYTFGGATSLKGVRILHGDADPCVIRRETITKEIAPGICNVRELIGGEMNGTIYLNKCVLRGTTGLIAVRDIGHHNSCVCKINAWEADELDVSGISQEIHDIIVAQEQKSTCSRILGRMLRNSWRRRVNIVNKDEVDVVVRTLINITEMTSTSLDVHDAEILLDTSSQISKYRFYDGLDNHSADLLIKSSTKYVSNLLRSAVMQSATNEGSLQSRSKRSADWNESSTTLGDSGLIQWKIMRNLEEIAENIVALIDIPKNSSKYVVEAREEAVDLHVTIAKNYSLNSLTNEKDTITVNSTVRSWNALATEISGYTQGDSVAVVTAYYNLMSENVTVDTTRASGVLAINPRVVKNGLVGSHLSLPVVFSLPVGRGSHHRDNGSKYLCSYHYESSTEPRTNWLQTGCQVKQLSNYTVTCECNHTTHFAVLMQLQYEELPERHVIALEYLSIAFGSLSIASLAVTIIVFLCYRHILLTHRTALHLNLAISLLGGYIALLLGSVFSSRHLDHPKTCFGFAIAAHLFFLSTFCWFLMEGIYLFYKVVMVFSTKWGEYGAKYAPLLGWGVPALIVILSVLTSRNLNNRHGAMGYDDAYYDDRTCFLESSNGMQWTFLAPAFLVILINTCVLMKVVSVIFQSARTSSTKGKTVTNAIRTSTKGLILLLPILGVPWIVNVFSSLPPPAGIAASYVHVVLIGLQGIAIFLFYCVFNSEVRKAIKLSTERRKSQASIETATKNRKRSQVPLMNSSNESPPGTRYKNSLTPISANGRTYTVTSQISNSKEPPSPNASTGVMTYRLSPLHEVSTAEK